MDSLRRKKAFELWADKIPINKKTNLPFIKNFINFVENDESQMTLYQYVSFLNVLHKGYWKNSKYTHESMSEYIERHCPEKK